MENRSRGMSLASFTKAPANWAGEKSICSHAVQLKAAVKWLRHKLELVGSVSSSGGFILAQGALEVRGKHSGEAWEGQGRMSSWARKLGQIQAGNGEPILKAIRAIHLPCSSQPPSPAGL